MSRGGEKDKGQEGTEIKQAHLQGQLCIFSQSIKTIQFLIGNKKTQLNCWRSWPAEEVGKMRKSMSIVWRHKDTENGKMESRKEKEF